MSVQVKQYEWQLWDGSQWLPIDHDDVIETHYCQAGAKGMTIFTEEGKVYIDFDTLQTQNAQSRVQRLSFLAPGEAESVGWYFRDDDLWREYGSQSSSSQSSAVSSKDVELQYTTNPQGSFTFAVGAMNYTLDFSAMTQRNCSTGLRRNVRRRPKFSHGPQSPQFPSLRLSIPQLPSLNVAPPPLPTGNAYKWEFLGEEGQWMEYQAHICSFDSATIETQYQANPQGQLHFRTKKFSYTLDFPNMCQTNDRIGTKRPVRRTADDGSQNILGGQPRWQFQDNGGVWKDFSNGNSRCSITNRDIEQHYQQNPSGTLKFTTNRFSYELNFSAMNQMNLSTTTVRPIQRLNQ